MSDDESQASGSLQSWLTGLLNRGLILFYSSEERLNCFTAIFPTCFNEKKNEEVLIQTPPPPISLQH